MKLIALCSPALGGVLLGVVGGDDGAGQGAERIAARDQAEATVALDQFDQRRVAGRQFAGRLFPVGGDHNSFCLKIRVFRWSTAAGQP